MSVKHVIWCLTSAALLSASVGFMKGERSAAQESAAVIHVNCDQGAGGENGGRGPLQRAIDTALPGASILVNGTCLENLTIPIGKDSLTLDGGGTAAITPAAQTLPAVLVRARDVTVRGFTITGGFGGVAITQGGRGIVDGNTIRDSGSYGVGASQLSSAVIVNNTIQNHFQAGIGVAETAYAFVGFVLSSDAVASPNLISGNRAQGIAVFRGSYARIVGNVITDNGANGVNVRESSSAQISDNTIEGNGGNGILVNQGSGVLLGTDSGNTIFTRPNKTTRSNVQYGIRCQVGANADGRLGTLNGLLGAELYVEGCIPSLIQ